MNKPMTVIQVTADNDGLEDVMKMMRAIIAFDVSHTVLDLRVGIDPIDNGLKFSVNGQVWSPPAHGVIL